MTLHTLLIFEACEDLRKPHYGSHVRDPMYHPMKMEIAIL